MPRLTNKTYVSIYQQLTELYRQDRLVVLSPSERSVLHSYFAPARGMTVSDLLLHRKQMTNSRPALPHQAGKVWVKLQRVLMEEAPSSSVPRVRSRRLPVAHSKQGSITVHTELRPEPDVQKIVRVLMQVVAAEVRVQTNAAGEEAGDRSAAA